MNAPLPAVVIKQHLIDPEICIRCNTCETMCPSGAITHDARNYVVDAAKCNWCNDCISPCPTGSIDNYRRVPQALAYTLDQQFGWDELPAELSRAELDAATAAPQVDGASMPAADGAAMAPVDDAGLPVGATPLNGTGAADTSAQAAADSGATLTTPSRHGATLPPWSAAHAYINLYGPRSAQASVTATVTGNVRVTAVGKDYDTHHLVLDFGAMPFPVLEGQSIGILPPGVDAAGRPHHARQYSIASPRNGERPGYNNLSLTVKRVLEDHQGRPVRGVASNHLCDLQVGDRCQVIGPFGSSFLMPNHPGSRIVMICTGTGSAPMRAMTEWRRRLRQGGAGHAEAGWSAARGAQSSAAPDGGKLLLFFGARTPEELPYFGPLQKLPADFIDIHFAFSRMPGQPKVHVQHKLRERAADLAPLLADANAHFYVCGLKAMEDGVLQALREVAQGAGLDWPATAAAMKREGRLHLETY